MSTCIKLWRCPRLHSNVTVLLFNMRNTIFRNVGPHILIMIFSRMSSIFWYMYITVTAADRGLILTLICLTAPGERCDMKDHCLSAPCKNGGHCHVTNNTYTCNCITGDPSKNCRLNEKDECQETPPSNTSAYITCIDRIGNKYDMIKNKTIYYRFRYRSLPATCYILLLNNIRLCVLVK